MHAFLIAITWTFLSSSLFGEESDEKSISQAEIAKAIDIAASLLVQNQESYEADPPVRPMPDDKLEDWQDGEKERLGKVRKDSQSPSEWPYEGVYRTGSSGQIPSGYRVGGTAIVCEALMMAPGFDEDTREKEAVNRGLTFILDRLENDQGMKPAKTSNYDVRGWGHAYALGCITHALSREVIESSDVKARAIAVLPHLMKCLKANETESGGWNYANGRPSSFMTASTLLTLFSVKDRGFVCDEGMMNNALDALEASRNEIGAFAYSGEGQATMPASCARSAAAELALFVGGRSSEERIRLAVDGFFQYWDELKKRKSQQGTHVGPHSIAPYYFFFGHTYVAMAIEYLDEGERETYREKLVEILWRTREEHGGWNDRIFPRTESYSTAMAVLALRAQGLPRFKISSESPR